MIKLHKINQTEKIDLPTIGLQTIKDLIKYGYSGVAISEKTQFLEYEQSIELANKEKIFIEVIKSE